MALVFPFAICRWHYLRHSSTVRLWTVEMGRSLRGCRVGRCRVSCGGSCVQVLTSGFLGLPNSTDGQIVGQHHRVLQRALVETVTISSPIDPR